MVKYGTSVAAGVDVPMAASLPINRASMTRAITVSLFACRSGPLVGVSSLQIARSRTACRLVVADRRTTAMATAHGVVRRLLVFKLSDKLALCFGKSVGDVRIPRDRY
jgi:hypothetical protein